MKLINNQQLLVAIVSNLKIFVANKMIITIM